MWLAWPAVMTVAVAAGALLPRARLLDGVTGAPAAGARLVLPPAYVALAPLTDVLDALSLLSQRQHYAFLTSVAVLFVGWRLGARWRRRATPGGEAGYVSVALAALVMLYGGGVLVPRPMAALALSHRDELAIDFHSHTDASWDGRNGFDAEANRRWHAAAGFAVAAISDHRSFAGALDGARANPLQAGAGTSLLPAIECVDDGSHVIAFGIHPTAVRPRRGDCVSARTARDGVVGHDPPAILIQTIPARLDVLPPPDGRGAGDIVAIELADACPRGLDQEDRDRSRILRLADSLDLAVVASSNNHGWGSAAAAWSVMKLPGWRSQTPGALAARIETAIRERRRRAVRIVERRRVSAPHTPASLAATLPAVTWTMLATLTPAERAAWLAWTWGLALVVMAWRGRRSSDVASAD